MATSLQNKAELHVNKRSSLALTLLFLHPQVYRGSGGGVGCLLCTERGGP